MEKIAGPGVNLSESIARANSPASIDNEMLRTHFLLRTINFPISDPSCATPNLAAYVSSALPHFYHQYLPDRSRITSAGDRGQKQRVKPLI